MQPTTPTPEKQRLTVFVADLESAAFEEFRAADRRGSIPEAIVVLALLGLDAWRKKDRPKAHSLVPEPLGDGNGAPASAPQA